MDLKGEKAVVCGAGGFIGGHLVKSLLENGVEVVRAVDVKPLDEWYQVTEGVENLSLDLKDQANCHRAAEGTTLVYQLAADMGGMGFIENNKALCMLSVLTNTHMLIAAKEAGVKRFFYSSSACVYNGEKQTNPNVVALKESDAYPALPEDGYGWEKLFSERMCRHFEEDFGLVARVARYHNVYGPHGTWNGGREKAPAAICRKVIEAKRSGKHEIEIWGDGGPDAQLHVHRRLRAGNADDHGERCRRADQSWVERAGDDQSAGGHRGGDCRREAEAEVQPERAEGRERAQQRQHDDSASGWAGSLRRRLRDGMEKTYRWIEGEIERGASGK